MNDELDDNLKSRLGFLVPLNKLPTDRQARLLDQSLLIDLRKKETLFKQGDRDDFTFYILEGEIEMYADESLIKRVSGGEGASFQPLAQLQPRQMSAVAKTKARVLQVKRSLLEQLLSVDDSPKATHLTAGVEVEEIESSHSGDWLMTLLQSELFTRIPPSNISGLLDTLESVEYKKGDEVIKQGDPGDYYYAVQSGTCEVVRAGANRRSIRLAELKSGDTFGEEALITGAKRNASVRMTSDGQLVRLTKDDFARLIKAPLLAKVDRTQAEAKVAAGAQWLDVRFEDEHAHNGFKGSANIPLGMLRTRCDELDPDKSYVAYCDTGGRSSAAAFLLAEKGFTACYVEGGAVTELPPPQAVAQAAAAPRPKPVPADPAPATVVTDVLETAARASMLTAEVEKASLTIQQAQKMMADAQAMKAEADRIVADKLERERSELAREQRALTERLAEAERIEAQLVERRKLSDEETRKQQEVAAREAEESKLAVHNQIAMQREKIERDAQLLDRKLAETESLKQSLAEQQRDAEETRRRQEDLEHRTQELKLATESRFSEQQKKLEAEYEALRSKLAEAESLKQALSEQQRKAAFETDKHVREVDKRLADLERESSTRLHDEEKRLEALYKKQAEQLESLQADREAGLREQLRHELDRERAHFEQVVSRTNEALELAREERTVALIAKEAAAADATRMIAEFKAAQETKLAEQQAAFAKERQRLHEEAARIEKLREEATRARHEAEATKAVAERELTEARARRDKVTEPEQSAVIAAIEQRASVAGHSLQEALAVEAAVVTAAKENDDELERTYDTANEINMLLQKELNQWVGEQDRLQESTLQREILTRQKEMVARIRARAAEAQSNLKQHDKSLLDEIQDQLSS